MANEQTFTPQPVSFDEFTPTSYAEWKDAAVASLKGAPFEKKLFNKTYEGVTLEPIYTEEMAEAFAQRLTFPGAEDYLRGVKAGGYAAEPWDIAQCVAVHDPVKANAVIKRELAKGSTALSFDAAKIGVSTLDDLCALLDGVCLDETKLNVYAGASALPLLGMLRARREKKGMTRSDYRGCVGADPIGEYALHGTSNASLECYYKQLAKAITFSKKTHPQLKTIFIQGSVYHNGGANCVQEVAAAMATAIAYIDALTELELSVDDVAQSIRFGFSQGANFFMEIAKLRAARVVWAQIVKAYGGSAESAKIDIAASTSAFTATKYDPYVNILRATTQAFSAVVGGVSEMTVTPFDAAIRESDELSRRVARNIQVMMQKEFGLLEPVDPAGGSWYVETLTGQLAEAIWAKLQDIDAKGGIVAVLQDGSLQAEIAAVLAERFKKLATRADKAVGTNMYANMVEKPLEASACCCGCQAAKAAAELPHIEHCLTKVAAAATAGGTLNAIAKSLCCGEAPTITAIAPHRWTEQFEALRSATDKHVAAGGENVKVFLCNMGPVSQHKARADFSAGFVEVAAFEALRNNGFATTDEAIAAAKESGAAVAVICSTDDTYPELVPVLASALKQAGIKVLLAGAPPAEYKEAWDAAGVSDYIHVKANCLQILSQIQKERGIC